MLSRGKVPNTYSANLTGETSRYMAQLELQMEGARTTHMDVGEAYFHCQKPAVESPGGRAIFARISSGWAGLGFEHGLCFEEVQGGVPRALRVVGNAPGLQNTGG